MDDIKSPRQIIDTFINAIYVYDDKLIFTYNYKDGSATITPEEIEEAFGSDLTQVAPPQFVRKRQFSDFFLVYFDQNFVQKPKNKGLSAPVFLLSFGEVRDKRADAQYVDGAA